MPTLEERLATLELRMEQLEALVNSGPSVPWSKSIRGRLHAVEQVERAAANLAGAARDMRRAQARTWSVRRQRLLLACAIATAAAPYLILLLHAH